jgi:LysM repeat protein
MMFSEDFKIFASTINGEAGASSVESQKAIAHSIMNRVGKREWKRHKSPVDIVKNTGYDAYTQKNSPYVNAYERMTSEIVGPKLQLLINAVLPIFNGTEADTTGGVVLYYSPNAQKSLHKAKPAIYKREQPSWVNSKVENVIVSGTQDDDFAWYRYKVATTKITFTDKAKQPIAGIEYKIESNGKKVAQGTTKTNGGISGDLIGEVGDELKIFVKKHDGTFKKIADTFHIGTDNFVNLISPKVKYVIKTEKHKGSKGAHIEQTYEIKSGDTLGSIAKKHHTKVANLAAVNHIKNINLISVGQVIKIPYEPIGGGIQHKAQLSSVSNKTKSQTYAVIPPPPKAKVESLRDDKGTPIAVIKSPIQAKLDLDKFAQTLEDNGQASSQHSCAKYVRWALEAAGADTKGHPVAAADWGQTLIKIGYKEISQDAYSPLQGDIYIIEKSDVHEYGHIAGYTGNQWICDFKQKSMVIYKDKVTYHFYRMTGD